MIKIENTDVYGFEAAIRGMRNPMNSWDKSDSRYNCRDARSCGIPIAFECSDSCYKPKYYIGENDLKLMKELVSAGSDHSKFMRMIHVTCDVTAPLYWLKEYDTYKVGTVANSCSTMHKIHNKPFDTEDFSHDHLCEASMVQLEATIQLLNYFRDLYNEHKDKTWWLQMIQLLPSSYNQRRTLDLNYAVLRNMYHARKNHKLDEWTTFCKWIESLPYSELITGGNNK